MTTLTRDDVAVALAALDESDDRIGSLYRLCQLVAEETIEACAREAERDVGGSAARRIRALASPLKTGAPT